MKSRFPGFYRPTKELFDKLFGEALIVFDANILLDLYRVSPETSSELMGVIKKLGDRLWIPYQVGLEYHKDLFLVVSGQIAKYKNAISDIESIEKSFAEKRNHPFLTDDLHAKTNSLFGELNTYFQSQCRQLESFIMEDSIKDELSTHLEGKMGKGFEQEEIEKIYAEGEKRYKCQVPPGYMDRSKPVEERYGDLIIWKEIIDKSKKDSKNIIFVTNDTKKDWFIEFEGKIYGPNPHLITEFKLLTGNNIYIYTLESFLSYANQFDIEVTEKALNELKERKENQNTEFSYGEVVNCQESMTEATAIWNQKVTSVCDTTEQTNSSINESL